MGATHAFRLTRWPAYLDHARGKGPTLQVSLSLSLSVWEELVVTQCQLKTC